MLTAEKATKLGHDHVTHLEAHRFVLFCCPFVDTVSFNLSTEIFA